MARKRRPSSKKRTKPRAAKDAAAPAATPPTLASLLQEFLRTQRANNIGLNTVQPLPPGTVGPELPLNRQIFSRLITAAATRGNTGAVVWEAEGSELQVITGKVTVDLNDGLIFLNIPVTCDQVSDATIQVPFAVGSTTAPAGLLVATEERPRGPDAVIAVWSEALVAFAWELLMTVATQAAAAIGTDTDRAALIPVAITANSDAVFVLTMARQAFDRVIS
jgi:hypothetical protein